LSKTRKLETPYDLTISLLDTWQKLMNSCSWSDIYTPMFIESLFTIEKI
jgi:hypothetical protein